MLDDAIRAALLADADIDGLPIQTASEDIGEDNAGGSLTITIDNVAYDMGVAGRRRWTCNANVSITPTSRTGENPRLHRAELAVAVRRLERSDVQEAESEGAAVLPDGFEIRSFELLPRAEPDAIRQGVPSEIRMVLFRVESNRDPEERS